MFKKLNIQYLPEPRSVTLELNNLYVYITGKNNEGGSVGAH